MLKLPLKVKLIAISLIMPIIRELLQEYYESLALILIIWEINC